MPRSDGYKNLVLWQKGQSGNPRGRPRRSLTRLLREAGEKGEILGEPMPPGMTVAEAFAAAVWGHAIKGNAAFAGQILDRLEGKAGPARDQDGDDDTRTIRVIVERISSPAPGVAPEPGEDQGGGEEI